MFWYEVGYGIIILGFGFLIGGLSVILGNFSFGVSCFLFNCDFSRGFFIVILFCVDFD